MVSYQHVIKLLVVHIDGEDLPLPAGLQLCRTRDPEQLLALEHPCPRIDAFGFCGSKQNKIEEFCGETLRLPRLHDRGIRDGWIRSAVRHMATAMATGAR